MKETLLVTAKGVFDTVGNVGGREPLGRVGKGLRKM